MRLSKGHFIVLTHTSASNNVHSERHLVHIGLDCTLHVTHVKNLLSFSDARDESNHVQTIHGHGHMGAVLQQCTSK